MLSFRTLTPVCKLTRSCKLVLVSGGRCDDASHGSSKVTQTWGILFVTFSGVIQVTSIWGVSSGHLEEAGIYNSTDSQSVSQNVMVSESHALKKNGFWCVLFQHSPCFFNRPKKSVFLSFGQLFDPQTSSKKQITSYQVMPKNTQVGGVLPQSSQRFFLYHFCYGEKQKPPEIRAPLWCGWRISLHDC